MLFLNGMPAQNAAHLHQGEAQKVCAFPIFRIVNARFRLLHSNALDCIVGTCFYKNLFACVKKELAKLRILSEFMKIALYNNIR